MHAKSLASVLIAGLAAGTALSAHAALEEIVVTAQKREQNLQEVPISITALPASVLEDSGISSTQDLTQVTPGLNFTQASLIAQPTVRGIGTRAFGLGDESMVPIYIDGAYQPTMAANIFQFNNIKQIEVLKGPQGTLFGRNSTGGAINITTKTPQFEPSGQLSLNYGSFNLREIGFYQTGGFGDRIAADIATLWSEDDGYIHDLVRGGDTGAQGTESYRAKVLFKATDDLDITVVGYRSNSEDNSIISGHPINGNTVARRVNPAQAYADDEYETTTSFEPFFRVSQYGGSLTADQHTDLFDIKWISAYQSTNFHNLTDSDYTTANLAVVDWRQRERSSTHELQFTSDAQGAVTWVGGLFYFRAESFLDPQVLLTSTVTPTTVTTRTTTYEPRSESDAYAVYGDATWNISDAWSLTGGLRQSWENKDLEQTVNGRDLYKVDDDWSELTPRLVVQYRPSADTNLYASYSRGFKSGVFNSSSATPLAAVEPETADAYEIGVKTSLTPDINVDAAAYYYLREDVQVQARDPVTAGLVLQNAAEAEIYGFDGSIAAFVTDSLSIRAGVAYTHSEFSDYENAQIFVPRVDFGNDQIFADVSGNALPRTPEWTGNIGATHNMPLWEGELTTSLNYYWSDEFAWDPSERLMQDAYGLLNASVAWMAPGERYKITVWGKNLTDEAVQRTVTTSATADVTVEDKPLTAGVTLNLYW